MSHRGAFGEYSDEGFLENAWQQGLEMACHRGKRQRPEAGRPNAIGVEM